jgi:putative transposase
LTETLDRVTARKKKPEPTAEEIAARELVRQAKEQGLSLTGPGGLLGQLTKRVLETALDEELTEHLGHEKHGPAVSGNVRNGTRPKTVVTPASGELEIEVPRCSNEATSVSRMTGCTAGQTRSRWRSA